MPHRQPAQSRAPRQSAKPRQSSSAPKRRWTSAERAERGRSTDRRSGPGRTSSNRWTDDNRPVRDPDRRGRVDTATKRTEPKRTEPKRTEPKRTEPKRTAWKSTQQKDTQPKDIQKKNTPTMNTPPDSVIPTETSTPPVATVAPPALAFADLALPPALVEGLAATGITTTFPIQAATIPDALAGRDVLGRGQTGSGKTLAFGLPLLTRLAGSGRTVRPAQARAVVLVPTRELAMQVTDALAPLARTLGLGIALVAGGMSYTPQLRAFERGVDVVVATPGRLLDLMERGAADLGEVEITVLDEADHMADLGFLPAVTTVLDTVPATGQRLLFSATLDHAVAHLVSTYLDRPVTHQVDSGRASVTTMDHRIVHVKPQEKHLITTEIAGREGRTVVFARTQLGAERIADQLRESGVLAGALHGGLSQSIRTRILAAFKDGQLPVLVATDVAARGIHVDEVGLVLQADPPAGPKEYLHRAGRTARAGGQGVVVTLVLPQQRREVSRLAAQAGVRSEPMLAGPGDARLAAVTGAQRPSGSAISRTDYDRVIAPRRSARNAEGRSARNADGRRFGRHGGGFEPGQRRRGKGPGKGPGSGPGNAPRMRHDGRGTGPRP